MMDSGFTLPFPHQLTSKECSSSTDYTCLRCCQPLKCYSSSDDLDCAGQQTLNKLSIPIYQVNKNVPINRGYEKSIHCKIMLPIELAETTSDFMFVDELGNLPLVNNQTLKVTSKLFDIMSDQSDVDHPLCEECTNNLLDQMDQQLRSAEDECKQYQEFLEKLPDDSNDENLEKLSKEFEDLLEIEAQLQKELSAIKEKDNETKQILKSVEDEYETLQREEDKQWKDLCRFERQYLNSEDNHLSFQNQLLYAQAQLDRLNKTNIFNATFHIWYNGHFGTINNFRMGRLPNVPVEWSEINAAWGQTVLLLHSLAKKMDFTFERYCLVPYGNHSYIESLENKSKDLPLYCLGGSGFMLDQRFDLAMVAFLDCLIQFKNHVELIDENYKLPYQMEKGKVKDSSSKSYSIKAQFNSEEQWTKALKYMLTNLKWALAWVSSQFQENSNL